MSKSQLRRFSFPLNSSLPLLLFLFSCDFLSQEVRSTLLLEISALRPQSAESLLTLLRGRLTFSNAEDKGEESELQEVAVLRHEVVVVVVVPLFDGTRLLPMPLLIITIELSDSTDVARLSWRENLFRKVVSEEDSESGDGEWLDKGLVGDLYLMKVGSDFELEQVLAWP